MLGNASKHLCSAIYAIIEYCLTVRARFRHAAFFPSSMHRFPQGEKQVACGRQKPWCALFRVPFQSADPMSWDVLQCIAITQPQEKRDVPVDFGPNNTSSNTVSFKGWRNCFYSHTIFLESQLVICQSFHLL